MVTYQLYSLRSGSYLWGWYSLKNKCMFVAYFPIKLVCIMVNLVTFPGNYSINNERSYSRTFKQLIGY